MKKLKIIGFIVLILGLCLKLWWVAILGWAIYEAGGITWIAAATSDEHMHRPHDDHGPMN